MSFVFLLYLCYVSLPRNASILYPFLHHVNCNTITHLFSHRFGALIHSTPMMGLWPVFCMIPAFCTSDLAWPMPNFAWPVDWAPSSLIPPLVPIVVGQSVQKLWLSGSNKSATCDFLTCSDSIWHYRTLISQQFKDMHHGCLFAPLVTSLLSLSPPPLLCFPLIIVGHVLV